VARRLHPGRPPRADRGLGTRSVRRPGRPPGVRATLGRGTAPDLDFLRAVDRVKKRELWAPCHLPLDLATAAAHCDRLGPDREALREAVAGLTVPREADLLAAAPAGDGPAAIAARWGLAAKTVSNEKARVLGKLRAALLAGPN
jgi:DNA-binding NarL/FixJ family response regulator